MNPLRTLNSLRALASLAEMFGLATKADVSALKSDIDVFKSDVDARFDQVDARFDQMEKTLLREIGQALNTAIETFACHLGAFDDRYKDLPARVMRLEHLVGVVGSR